MIRNKFRLNTLLPAAICCHYFTSCQISAWRLTNPLGSCHGLNIYRELSYWVHESFQNPKPGLRLFLLTSLMDICAPMDFRCGLSSGWVTIVLVCLCSFLHLHLSIYISIYVYIYEIVVFVFPELLPLFHPTSSFESDFVCLFFFNILLPLPLTFLMRNSMTTQSRFFLRCIKFKGQDLLLWNKMKDWKSYVSTSRPTSFYLLL